jgi:hypothetical protein
MNKIYKLVICLVIFFSGKSFSQICNPSGNLVIYSNYDGGIININCDVNIPNLKIGICTYEAAEIHIIGTFSNNVTGIIYAGYDGANDNCNLGVITTSIIGSSSQTINVYPLLGPYSPVHGNGNNYMDGCYQCDTTISSGGVNSPDEVVFYFQNEFPGAILRSHHTQYGCWLPTTFNLSAGGNCCIMPAGSNPCVPPATPTDITVAANKNICAGNTSTLAVNSGTTVNWFATNTSTTVLGIGTSFITNTLSVGNYTYYAAAVNSCSASVRVPISVTVNPLPSLTVTASTPSICMGQAVNLTAGGANTYSWSTNATTSSISVSPAVTTVYTVTGTSSASCKNTATISVNVVTCTAIFAANASTISFAIFPNPAKDMLHLRSQAGKKKMSITDLTGKLMYEGETIEENVQIDVSKLAKGIYIFTLSQNGILRNEKLIID